MANPVDRSFRARAALAVPVALAAFVALAALGLPLAAGAQNNAGAGAAAATSHAASHAAAPVARAAPRSGAIGIDGRLDEAAWAAATPITDFRQFDPNEGAPASERTEARLLVDGDAVYVGVRMFDREPHAIQRQLARRDESIEGDIVEVIIDSYHDHNTAYLFRLSAAGARRDASVASNGGQDNSWDAVWEGAATVDSLGWTAEFRIPLSQLRYDPRQLDHTWGLQIGRKIARKAEVSLFAFTPKNQQQGVNRYGHVGGLGKLPSPRRIEATPYLLAKNQHPTVAANDPFRRQNEIVPGAGLDLKYGITSNFTLDATINPDFGQVEVDPAVVNLSAFETFFSERRPFFVEGASIFRFGGMRTQNNSNGYTFLHTRRIGRSPQRSLGGSLDGSSVRFVDAPLETTIAGAAKLTGRSANGWSIGLLDAVTTDEEARYRLADGRDGRATVEPMANYFMGRVKRDLRQGNTTVGAALNTVHRDLGDPALEPIFRSSAYAGGVDWQHAWHNRAWAFDGAVVLSHNRGSEQAIQALQLSPARYYQRPDREESLLDPTRTSLSGHVAEVTLAKLSGKWRGSVTAQQYSPGFEINEAGFIGSTDMRGIAPLISYQENAPSRLLRNWSQYLFWNPTWNFDGDQTFNGVGAMTFYELPSFWYGMFRLDWRPSTYDDRLTRGGPVGVVPTQYGVQADVNSDRRKRHTAGLFLSRQWNVEGGWSVNVQPRATLRPSTALRVTFSPSYFRTHAMAQYVTRVTDPAAAATYGARYLFATMDQHQLALVTRVDWTFTPTLSLQLFAQPLVAAADFQDYKQLTAPRLFDFDVFGRDAGTIARSDAGVYTVDPDGAGGAAAFSFGDRDFNQRSLRGNAVLRWEYRPGSALFLVWQQRRFEQVGTGEFGPRQDLGELWGTRPENVFVVKGTWWVGR